MDAVQDEKERKEKERVKMDNVSVPSIYTAPPLSAAEHDSNEREVRESLCSDVRVTATAPPFVAEQLMNAIPERVTSPGTETNSNTPPFPSLRLMESNVFVPERVRESIDTSINEDYFSVVVAPFEDVNVILLSARLPSDTTIKEDSPVIIL